MEEYHGRWVPWYNVSMSGIYVLLAFVLGWLIAQSCKLIGAIVKKRGKLHLSDVIFYMTKSGGMPSGHTASFTAVTMYLLMSLGPNSAIFGLAACMTVIIIYDATNVRYAVGEQGKLLNEIARTDNNAKTKPQKLVEGHTVPQVIVGAIIGIILGYLVFLMQKNAILPEIF